VEDLLSIARDQNVSNSQSSTYGTIVAPNGSSVAMRTVWIVEVELGQPRFVTAYPV